MRTNVEESLSWSGISFLLGDAGMGRRKANKIRTPYRKHGEGGVPCRINTESNSININAQVPKQSGSTQSTTFIKKKKKRKKGSVSKNSIGILARYLLPCQQCSKMKKERENPVHVHESSIPHGRGLN